jgi:hypothetical protein
LEWDEFFNSICEKTDSEGLETDYYCALELFAPILIHECRNRSIVYTLPRILPAQKHWSWSAMSALGLGDWLTG